MLQILAISAFPEIIYEFGILGQKSRNFLKKSRKKVGKGKKKNRKSRTTCKPALE